MSLTAATSKNSEIRILLAEDSLQFGERIYDPLIDRGYSVDWVSEFLQANEQGFRGCLALNQDPIDSQWASYTFAFVDDDLNGQIKGPMIIPFLLRHRVRGCGISSYSSGRLRLAGITLDCQKAKVPAQIDHLLEQLRA